MLRAINLVCLLLAVAWFARSPDWEPAIVGLGLLGALGVQEWFLGLRFLDRGQVDSRLGTLEERLAKVKSSVWISGNDCKFVVEASSAALDGALARGVRLKLLLVDPDGDAPEMLAQVDPRFPTSQHFRDSMYEVLTRLEEWRERYPTLFEYRLLSVLPAMGFFIMDHESGGGTVKVEIYSAKPWRPISSRPHFVLSRLSGAWRSYFLAQWENYWGMARGPV